MEMDLAVYADARGRLCTAELEAALLAAVDDGDRLHDSTEWSEPLLEYDSWLNRRLAIALRGWGDIVERREADPASLQTLRDMEALAEWVCSVLHNRSRYLAQHNNWCPALDEAGALLMQKERSRAWGRRWKKALAAVAVRHRNLTTLSPWDIFPRGKAADLRYANLLPLMRFADSLSFQRETSIANWNVNDFKGFYDRVAAITRAGHGAGFIAKQV